MDEPAEPDSAEDVEEWLMELLELVHPVLPQGSLAGSPGLHFAALLAFRQVATYNAVVVLLAHGFHAEATALIRRQFEDTQRLAYLHRHPEKADGLYFGLMWKQLSARKEELESLAVSNPAIEPLRQAILEEERELRSAHEAAGVKKIRWEGPTALAQHLGREGDRLVWASTSPAAHSGFSVSAPYSVEDGRTFIALSSGNLKERIALGRSAGRYMCESIALAGELLNWSGVSTATHRIFKQWAAHDRE